MSMAERRHPVFAQTPELNFLQIIQDAQNRWLRPLEICEVLCNYSKHKVKLNSVVPYRPLSGTLHLFDRRVLRYFRKDGHNWKKKKDGKTVREAHERLKVGSMEVLHCYYAHGQDNVGFLRRCYWMLDATLEHIVLVHYRDVSKGKNPSPQTSPTCSLNNLGSVTTPETPVLDGLSHSADVCDLGVAEDVDAPKVEGNRYSLLEQLSGALNTHQQECHRHVDISEKTLPASGVKSSTVTGRSEQVDPSYAVRTSRYMGLHLDVQGLNQRVSALAGASAGIEDASCTNMLSSPGSYFSALELSSPTNFDTLHTTAAVDNRVGLSSFFTKPEVDSPSWADILAQYAASTEQKKLLNTETALENMGRLSNTDFGPNMESTDSLASKIDALTAAGPFEEEKPDLEARLRVLAEGTIRKSSEMGGPQLNDYQGPITPAQPDQSESTQGHGVASDDEFLLHAEESTPRLGNVAEYYKIDNDLAQLQNDNQKRDELPFSSSSENRTSFSENRNILPPSVPSIAEGVESNEMGWRLDSFGQWMKSEFGNGDPFYPLAESGVSWETTTSAGHGVVEGSSNISQDLLMNIGSSPSSCHDFSITDFSPQWSFANEESKVLITGSYSSQLKEFSKSKWSCMFGQVEVPVEVLGNGVLRCKAPQLGPGKVPFFITRSDRCVCSQVLEFEYRPLKDMLHEYLVDSLPGAQEELQLQIRLFRLLSKSLRNAACWNQRSRSKGQYSDDSKDLALLENLLQSGSKAVNEVKEELIQLLAKQKLEERVGLVRDQEDTGIFVWDDYGQGLPHLAAALGYVWSVKLFLRAGIPINWRDRQGWTSLHWAAHSGRENMVLELVAAGASPGAVTDPTSKSPAGLTPADIASTNGHKGIGAYLAEILLAGRLSSMTLAQNELHETETMSAALAGEQAVAQLSRRATMQMTLTGVNDPVGLAESLEAVRDAVTAASLIQSAFRLHLARRKRLIEVDEYGLSEDQLQTLLGAQKFQKFYGGHQQKKQHLAATRIQQKFRGWKCRKEFLLTRQRIIKLQARVRGCLARGKYKKILWAVGIVEKAILRWRSKRRGLRGFVVSRLHGRNGLSSDDSDDDENLLRKQTEAATGKAVCRVRSMALNPDARAQYHRLKEDAKTASQQLNLKAWLADTQQMDVDLEVGDQTTWLEELY